MKNILLVLISLNKYPQHVLFYCYCFVFLWRNQKNIKFVNWKNKKKKNVRSYDIFWWSNKKTQLRRKKKKCIATDKAFFFIRKILISFSFLHENICCGYPLEASWRGASNEYPQHMFSWRNEKNIMWIPPLICSYENKALTLNKIPVFSYNYRPEPVLFWRKNSKIKKSLSYLLTNFFQHVSGNPAIFFFYALSGLHRQHIEMPPHTTQINMKIPVFVFFPWKRASTT